MLCSLGPDTLLGKGFRAERPAQRASKATDEQGGGSSFKPATRITTRLDEMAGINLEFAFHGLPSATEYIRCVLIINSRASSVLRS